MRKVLYINGSTFMLSEEYGHYVIRDFDTNAINCTCDYGELNNTLEELEQADLS